MGAVWCGSVLDVCCGAQEVTQEQFEALFILLFAIGLIGCFALGVIAGNQR
jgi:hypothetical protein